jgi:hypothetical protein
MTVLGPLNNILKKNRNEQFSGVLTLDISIGTAMGNLRPFLKVGYRNIYVKRTLI